MRTKKVYAVFGLVCAIFGTTFLAIRIGVSFGAPPLLFAGARFSAAGLVLGLALLASKRARLSDLIRLAPRAALLSLFYIVINFGGMFWAEQYIASSTAAQIDAIGPIASAMLSAAFLGKRLRPAHGLGIAAGFAGVWLIVRGVGPASAGPGIGRESLIASIVMLCAAVGFAGASVLYRKLFDDGVDSFAVNSLNMLFGGLALLALSAVSGEGAFPLRSETIGALAYLIVAGSLVGHSANLWLVKKAGPLFTSSWCYVSPVIATAVGAAALGERVSPWSFAGAVATLFGVYLITKAEMQPKPGPEIRAVPSEEPNQ
jgi:drug/metabolite transporter (DMT)-like permease